MIVSAAFSLLLLMAQDNVIVRQVNPADRVEAEAPIEQLSKPGEANIDTGPVKSDDASADLVPQLSNADTDVEFARVEGMDRCSAELLSAEDADYCARRLEARSVEFATQNEARLSAEQILIGENFASTVEGDVAGSSRLAGREVRPEDRDMQALASITLGSTTTASDTLIAEDNTSNLPAETQALIEAIVEQVGAASGGGG